MCFFLQDECHTPPISLLSGKGEDTVSHYVRRRRANGQFAPALDLSGPPQTPPTRPPRPYQRLSAAQRPTGPITELSPAHKPSVAEVISVLEVARARLHSAEDNITITWVADLEPAREHWRNQAHIAEKHVDVPASDAFYEIVHVSEQLSRYLSQTPVFECHHVGKEECENCHHIDVDDKLDEIIDNYTVQANQ